MVRDIYAGPPASFIRALVAALKGGASHAQAQVHRLLVFRWLALEVFIGFFNEIHSARNNAKVGSLGENRAAVETCFSRCTRNGGSAAGNTGNRGRRQFHVELTEPTRLETREARAP